MRVWIRDGAVQLPQRVHVLQDVDEAEGEDGHHVKGERQQEQEEVAVVSPPDAVVDPGAVMVEILTAADDRVGRILATKLLSFLFFSLPPHNLNLPLNCSSDEGSQKRIDLINEIPRPPSHSIHHSLYRLGPHRLAASPRPSTRPCALPPLRSGLCVH